MIPLCTTGRHFVLPVVHPSDYHYIKRLINSLVGWLAGWLAPQYLYNCTTGERFDIFSKFFLQHVDMHKESSQVHGQCSVGVMRGVAGPRQFFVTKLLQENG